MPRTHKEKQLIRQRRQKEIDRRKFLKIAGVTAVSGVFACLGISELLNYLSEETPKDAPNSLPPPPENGVLGSEFAEVLEHYPEIIGQPVYETITFQTNNADVKIINFTTTKINTNAAMGAFQFMENLLQSGVLTDFIYSGDDNTYAFNAKPTNIKPRVFFIIPSDFPDPYWLREYGIIRPKGITSHLPIHQDITPSIVRLDRSTPTTNSGAFFTEICQSEILIQTQLLEGSLTTPYGIGQEMGCLSASAMYEAKFEGMDFPQYQAYMETQFLPPLPPVTIDFLPMFTFPEELFDLINTDPFFSE